LFSSLNPARVIYDQLNKKVKVTQGYGHVKGIVPSSHPPTVTDSIFFFHRYYAIVTPANEAA
jgi:hypothetical protein